MTRKHPEKSKKLEAPTWPRKLFLGDIVYIDRDKDPLYKIALLYIGSQKEKGNWAQLDGWHDIFLGIPGITSDLDHNWAFRALRRRPMHESVFVFPKYQRSRYKLISSYKDAL